MTNGEEKKQPRQTSAKKCDCPFLLSGQKLTTSNDWILKVECGVHNHSSAKHLEWHLFARRLTAEETKILVAMSKSNIKAREILTTLKVRDKQNISTITTIYNAKKKKKHKDMEKAGRSQIQQLMSKLAEHNYVEWHRSDDDTDTIRDLFWAHPVGLDLLHSFSRILLMDCTYKTNMYRLPLLEIVEITSTKYTFAIAFVYLEFKREDNFMWALERLKILMDIPDVIVTDRDIALMNALQKVFPNTKSLLCRWHISKNVLAKCGKFFDTKETFNRFLSSWNMLILSSTKVEYNRKLKELEENFGNYPKALAYVKDIWLSKYKERFIAAWTNSIMHLGTVTTSRVESAHSKLKRHLRSSQLDFETSWSIIHDLFELQHTEIKASFEKSLTTVQHNFEPMLFRELRGFVSISALTMVLEESYRANNIGFDVQACGCVIRNTHGLPCAHEINNYRMERGHIPLACIDPHWKKLDFTSSSNQSLDEISCTAEVDLFVKRFQIADVATKLHLLRKLRELVDPSTTYLVEPKIKMNPRGRPSSKLETSTRRNPSAFEYVSQEDSQLCKSSAVTTKPKRKAPKRKAHQSLLQSSQSYINSFPCGLEPYIHLVKDVARDGNCGFRAIADLIGMCEDNWLQVRKDLTGELLAHRDNYSRLYGCSDRVDELHHALSYFNSYPGPEYWMSMPDMGHLIASHYNVVLLPLSQQQCLTFLPLRSNPLPTTSRKVIAISFVNGNHFVEMFMLFGCPIPPIATNWFRHHNVCANGWETPYVARIKEFRDLVGTEVATQETIDLDDP